MAKIGKLICLVSSLFLLAISVRAEEAPKITTIVQPNPVALDDSTQLRIQISSNSTDKVSPPEFDAPGFSLVGQSSSRSVNMNFGSGGATLAQSTIFTYVLFPKKDGAQKISHIRVKVGDKEYPTPDIMVKVLPSDNGGGGQLQNPDEEENNPAAPKNFRANNDNDSESQPQKLNSDFTVFVSLDKKTAYVGEPIVASYWIYASTPLREINIKRWPNFNGFWKEDLMIPSRYDWEQVMVNGKLVARSLVGRFALFGLKPGKLRLEQLLVSAKYIDARRGGDFDDDPFFFPTFSGRLRAGSHGSAPEQLEILPLPEAGRPSDYGGAVGEFKISFSHDKNEVNANSPLNFTFTVEGTGNFHAIEKIKIPFPPDFEVYDTKTNFQANAQIGSTRNLANKKSFNYLVLPRKEGSFNIPEIRFSYFDPAKKTYRTFTTEPKNITVNPDPNAGQGGTNTYTTTPEQSTAPSSASKPELRYLKTELSEFPLKTWVIRLLILINALLALYLLASNVPLGEIRGRLSRSPRRKIALAAAKLARAGTSRSEHYRLVEVAILEIEEILLGRPTSGMTKDEREQAWKDAGLPKKLLIDLETLLEHAERERYKAAGNEKLPAESAKANIDKVRTLANTAMKQVSR